jgi:hypothetical protein
LCVDKGQSETTEKVLFLEKCQRSYAGFKPQISEKIDFFSNLGQSPCHGRKPEEPSPWLQKHYDCI